MLDAAGTRELGTSDDRAAVLDWRLGRSATQGPLPWLDSIPARLQEHPIWGSYLLNRSDRVATLAASMRAEAEAWTPTTTPTWAAGLTADEDADLRAGLAVWRAAFAVPDDDRRPTGPFQAGSSTATHQQELNRRARAVLGSHRADATLLDLLPDEVRTDTEFARLSERLGALEAAQIDVTSLLTRALEVDRPLPDERAADALWWRIVRHLGPAALRASGNHSHNLRPAWTAYLTERIGEATAERVMADAMWPALVAAVHARPTEWTPEQLLDAATSGRWARRTPRRSVLCAGVADRHDDGCAVRRAGAAGARLRSRRRDRGPGGPRDRRAEHAGRSDPRTQPVGARPLLIDVQPLVGTRLPAPTARNGPSR